MGGRLDIVQSSTVRYIGLFLEDDPLDVPWSVIEHWPRSCRSRTRRW
nr:hypothetical protein [Streptomyces hygroscopicus]